MALDDTRCGFDTSSLHRATSMDISLSKMFHLLSCHRDTSSIARYKTKQKAEKLYSQLMFYKQSPKDFRSHLCKITRLYFVQSHITN